MGPRPKMKIKTVARIKLGVYTTWDTIGRGKGHGSSPSHRRQRRPSKVTTNHIEYPKSTTKKIETHNSKWKTKNTIIVRHWSEMPWCAEVKSPSVTPPHAMTNVNRQRKRLEQLENEKKGNLIPLKAKFERNSTTPNQAIATTKACHLAPPSYGLNLA